MLKKPSLFLLPVLALSNVQAGQFVVDVAYQLES